MEIKFKQRTQCNITYKAAMDIGLSPLLSRLIAGRVQNFDGNLQHIINPFLKYIAHPSLLKDCDKAAMRIGEAIINKETIGIITDYDVDGITSHAIIFFALTQHFFVKKLLIKSFISHRINDGYGISDNLTYKILNNSDLPNIVISADCGSSDEKNLKKLKKAGIDCIVTDHHSMPKSGGPKSAFAVVNPKQKECLYPDKFIAGCMVAWLVMCQVRNYLINQGYISNKTPKLGNLLDFVSLGTIADAVSLFSITNRAIVNTGIDLINKHIRPCWQAAHYMLNKGQKPFSSDDLGFQIGPRINARGRMDDPYAALHYLLAENFYDAVKFFSILDKNNKQRKHVEQIMLHSAKKQVQKQINKKTVSLIAASSKFHAGVQGIVASRLVDMYGKPTVIMSEAKNRDYLTGSARTTGGIHIYRVLQYVDQNYPDICVMFGGHKEAAGVTIYKDRLSDFVFAFEQGVKTQSGEKEFFPIIWTDGELLEHEISLSTFQNINMLQPFGNNFEEPVFEGIFDVKSIKVIGAEPIHLSIEVIMGGVISRAVWFRALNKPGDPPPFSKGDKIKCAYTLNLNNFRGADNLQLIIKQAVVI